MRTLEKLLAILAVLLLVCAGVFPLLWLNGVATPESLGLLAWFDAVQSASRNPEGVLRVVGPSSFAILFGVVLLWGLIVPKRAPRLFPVWEDEMGRFALAPEAVEGLVKHVGSKVRGVLGVECRSRLLKDQTVGLKCRLQLHTDAASQETSRQFRDKVIEELTEKAGLKVGDLDVVGRYDESRARPRSGGRGLA